MLKLSHILLTVLLLPSLSVASPKLIYNVKGYTISQGQWQEFEAILFDEGKVLSTGTTSGLNNKAKPWNRFDGEGAMLMPGLIDAHGHLLGLGLNLSRIDMRSADSLKKSLKMIRDYAEKHPDHQWLQGRGWNQVLWEDNKKQFPDKQNLDELSIDKPIWMRRIDGHAGWANSKALELAGVSKNTLDPAGGKIYRDKNGEPTGILVDNAMDLIEKNIPALNPQERRDALDAAFLHLNELGITSMHDAGTDADTLDMLLKQSAQGGLPVRVYSMLSGADNRLESMLSYGHINEPDLKVRSVKLYADGALGSRGAWLLEPYHDDPGQSGLALVEPEQLKKDFHYLANLGYQVNVHAIGDKANRTVLDVIESLPVSSSSKKLRHRIEHAQIVAVEDIPRFAELHVIASMQPTHATSDMNMAPDRLGERRLAGAYAWRKMLDNKVVMASGSDFPVELANPYDGIYSAVTRMDKDGNPKGGWLPSEKLSMQEAIRSFTLDAAFSGFWENELGSLEPGKQADFILLDQNLFTIPVHNIPQIKVHQTWVGGTLKYDAASNKAAQ